LSSADPLNQKSLLTGPTGKAQRVDQTASSMDAFALHPLPGLRH
jgi:hypothetical protein